LGLPGVVLLGVDVTVDLAWVAAHPGRAAVWMDGHRSGWEAAAATRATDDELERWAADLIERAYAAGYAAGSAVSEHRADARVLTSAAKVATDRARYGYIPRTRKVDISPGPAARLGRVAT
jgi:hypothetical protein